MRVYKVLCRVKDVTGLLYYAKLSIVHSLNLRNLRYDPQHEHYN